MSEIPDDIIEAGRLEAERYARWLHTMKTKGSLSPRAIEGLADIFSRLVFSERQRTDDLIAEAKRVLEPLVGAADLADSPYALDAVMVDLDRLRAASAFLAKLTEGGANA